MLTGKLNSKTVAIKRLKNKITKFQKFYISLYMWPVNCPN